MVALLNHGRADIWNALAHATLRPVTEADTAMIDRMLARLSAQTYYLRFFTPRSASQAETARLARQISQRSGPHLTLVSTLICDGVEEAIALAELVEAPGHPGSGEIALVVHDPYQARGLGTFLLQRLLEWARNNRLHSLRGIMLGENRRPLRMIQRLGLPYTSSTIRGEMLVELAL